MPASSLARRIDLPRSLVRARLGACRDLHRRRRLGDRAPANFVEGAVQAATSWCDGGDLLPLALHLGRESGRRAVAREPSQARYPLDDSGRRRFSDSSLGVHYGSFAAAGSDSYGYVSQARLWLDGTLRVAQPWVEQLSWPNREWAFTPLGYRPYSGAGNDCPNVSAWLARWSWQSFSRLLGQNGPFFVVPAFAALTLWLTYLLGKDATGSKVSGGYCNVMLLLASPVFLAHLMVPMSDVPAAAGWTLVAVLV